MKNKHLYLISKLNELFDTITAKKNRGLFVCGQDILLTGNQLECPDLAYFSREQIINSKTEEQIPEFVIEVISSTDQINEVKRKIIEYFKNGIRVAWLIYPDYEMVEIYTSLKHITVCTDADICSARPVLDDFEIAAADLWN